MDDLQFRRAIYADPKCTDDDVVQAAKHDPAKQAFWSELKQLDGSIQQASQVEVPPDLAHKLLLKHSFESRQESRKRNRNWLAMAASVAIVFGLFLSLWHQPGVVNLGEHALAHVQHEGNGYALRENGDISVQAVNIKLASLGAQLSEKVGRIYYANFCNFEGVRSLHLVMQGESGKVTVFIIPETDRLIMQDRFSNQQLAGQRIKAQHANIVLVNQKDQPVEQFKYKLKHSLMFSA